MTVLLVGKSLKDFSQTGPQLKQEVATHYRGYLLFALARLGGWSFVLVAAMAAIGVAIFTFVAMILAVAPSFTAVLLAAAAGFVALTAMQLCRVLLRVPATFAASSQYQMRRFVSLWHHLTVNRIRVAEQAFIWAACLLAIGALVRLAGYGEWREFGSLGAILAGVLGISRWVGGPRPQRPGEVNPVERSERPNIVMIGSDTLRADRLGVAGYRRALTPFIDSLVERGSLFSNCFVPCARTAPSLVSMLTGCWPSAHGIRDNFVTSSEAQLPVDTLPKILRRAGYSTAVVGDWAAADLGKFPLGFEVRDVPEDQWNLKYLLRQGPKDIRLFLSMFTRNRFGKVFLPELYYLAGIPLTRQVGATARVHIDALADGGKPFLLNIFMASTHPPFGSDYPYYTLYADTSYAGESKFAMARLTDPFEIIRRQGDSRKEFDLDQVIDLYDGCVSSFDDEVRRIVRHLEQRSLLDNTILLIYSDHGMEFFERDTWGQGNSVLSDVSPRIPLLVVDPRWRSGRRHDFVTRSIDVAPTLLELVGLRPDTAMHGVSLAKWLAGDCGDPELAAYNETGIWITDLPGMPAEHLRYPGLIEILEVPDKASGTLGVKSEYRNAVITAKDRMLRLGRWKLVYRPLESGATYALFDGHADAACQHDLSADYPTVLEEMRTLLRRWLRADCASI